eukprot:maker-scaffold350_size199587-snap-gene-0.24 protein:Tk01162 transcript:maker-scaffold350_size199587-snap-gene-0.24-mRNA-1 annotation:"hypothetical protein DAPPUDRAFT_206200"
MRGEAARKRGFQQCKLFFEYETPKVVTIQNVPLGILRVSLQLVVLSFVIFYQLWYARGYQEFANVESSVTTKVKGISKSTLSERAKEKIPNYLHEMYERIWDEADYVVPPAENGAFFVMTNMVITPNQTRGVCTENINMQGSREDCNTKNNSCKEGQLIDPIKGHGTQTGRCVPSQFLEFRCEIQSWCPIELDDLPMGFEEDGPLIPGFFNYTVFIKNSVAFRRFGEQYARKNMKNLEEESAICLYQEGLPEAHLCPIFNLGDIVSIASGGKFSKLSTYGGVIGIEITWNCDLDWDFFEFCLPRYNFRVLDDYGWNFRYALYHEENRRTLVKAYGLKFLLIINGRASKFNLKNAIIVLVTGVGLLGLTTMFCDFVLLNYAQERN